MLHYSLKKMKRKILTAESYYIYVPILISHQYGLFSFNVKCFDHEK
jgi:hypothetical protein